MEGEQSRMQFLLYIAYFIAIMLILFVALALLKKFVFSKVRINKYIPLGLATGLFVFQLIFKVNNFFLSSALIIVIALLFAWFWDIHETGGPKKGDKKIVIKPKAKPNRVKNKK